MLKKTSNYMRVFIGLVFLSAAVYRLLDYSRGIVEFENLNIPAFLIIPVIALELICGTLLIVNKYTKTASISIIGFLIIAIILVAIFNFSKIVATFPDLFIMNADATDVLLHMTYIGFLVFIFKNSKLLD